MDEPSVKKICPPPEELSNIKTDVSCTEPGCTSMFCNTSNLNMHLFKVHKVGDPQLWKRSKGNVATATRYYCPEERCVYNIESERFFQKLKYLKQHYLKVHAVKSFKCATCEKGFPTEATLKHHTPICGVKFTCACNASYSSIGALMTHGKRTGHNIENKCKTTAPKKSEEPAAPTPITIPVYLAAVALSELSNGCFKTVNDIGIQTEPLSCVKRVQRITCKSAERSTKRGTSIETQTGAPKKKRTRISAETQTSGEFFASTDREQTSAKTSTKCGKPATTMTKRRKSMETQTTSAVKRAKDDIRTTTKDDPRRKRDKQTTIAPCVLARRTSGELDIDVSSSDFWTGQRNSSSTQTSPGKACDLEMLNGITQTDPNLYGLFESEPSTSLMHCRSQTIKLSAYSEDNNSNSGFNVDTSQQAHDSSAGYPGQTYPGSVKIDEILAREKYTLDLLHRSCSIETQTEIDSFLLPTECLEEDSRDSFTLSSTIETQTTDDMETLDQLVYSNMCTQTCDEFLFSDLGFVDIQTQTAWSQFSAELSFASAETQTRSSSHMETQTDEFREMIAEFEKQNKSEELL